tara:strand:+ start:73 stop:270 length:198 start_codon:yes stop_codon:yes gene_type:complete
MEEISKMAKRGLYDNINAKQKRQAAQKAAGRKVEPTRKVGSPGAPTKKAFIQSAKTAKPTKKSRA